MNQAKRLCLECSMSLVRLSCHPEGQSLGAAVQVDLSLTGKDEEECVTVRMDL